jgi:hypothetical protein
MGASAQQQPVYYDTETSQYYTVKPQQNNNNGYLGALFGSGVFGGIPSSSNPFYASQIANRNYLGSPYGSANPDRFKPKTITPQYPEMNMLFPGLNAALTQGLMSSTQPDGAMYGAGRFLAPQTNNTAPQTTNTEGK